jgi:hypothetical protein
MKTRFAYVAIFLFLSLAFASNGFAQNPPKKANQNSQKVSREAPLSNADVVKLMKLELGDEIVIAKINQAKAVNFDLSTDGLIQLKRDGVSKEVISAMLKMTTPQTQAPAQSQAPSQTVASSTPASSGTSTNSSAPARVLLRSKAGDVELTGRRGESKLVYAFITALQFQQYPVLTAKVRVQDSRPTILVPLQEDPKRSLVYLVRLESDQKTDSRSLKIGSGMFGSASGLFGKDQEGGSPDSDWVIPFDASEDRPGIWSIVPKSDLAPGEYGYYYRGVLYDFGIDK